MKVYSWLLHVFHNTTPVAPWRGGVGTRNTAGNSGAVVHAKLSQWSTIGNKIWLSLRPRNFGNDKIVCLRSIFLRAPLIWLWQNFCFRWDQKNDTWMLSEILRTLIVNIDYRVSIVAKKKIIMVSVACGLFLKRYSIETWQLLPTLLNRTNWLLLVLYFQRNGQTVYKTVSFAGYVGVISGLKPVRIPFNLWETA